MINMTATQPDSMIAKGGSTTCVDLHLLPWLKSAKLVLVLLCSCSLAQVSQGGEVLCGEKQRLPNLHLSPQSSFLTLPPSLPPCTADNKYLLEKNSTNFGGISFLCHRRPFVFLLLDLLLLNLAFTNSKLLPSHGSWVPTQ